MSYYKGVVGFKDIVNKLTRMFPKSSIFNLNPCPILRMVSSVAASLIGLSNPATPMRNPSNPSSDPLMVRTGALA